MDWAQVCTLRDGLIWRIEAWTDGQKPPKPCGCRS